MLNVIEAIERQLQAQKDDIFFKDIEIKDLKVKVAELQAENKRLKGN